MPCVFTATQLAHHYKTNILGSQECEQSLYHISCSLKEYFLYQRTWTFFRSHVHISWIIKSMGTNSNAHECSTTAFSHISGWMNLLQISWILSCQGRTHTKHRVSICLPLWLCYTFLASCTDHEQNAMSTRSLQQLFHISLGSYTCR